MTGIDASYLKNPTRLNDEPFEYLVPPEHLQISSDNRGPFDTYCDELRRLLRVKSSVEEALRTLLELNKKYLEQIPPSDINSAATALLCLSLNYYAACFLLGEGYRRPLADLGLDMRGNSTHDELMDFRHKLFAHLDENHSVRFEVLGWTLRVCGNMLTPTKPQLTWERLRFPSFEKLQSWLAHFIFILKEIEIRVEDRTQKVNKLLGQVEVRNTCIDRGTR